MTPIEKDHSKGLNGAVAETLRGERAAQRMTIEALADRSDIPYRTLLRYLNGERAITMAVLEPVALALGTTPHDVMQMAERRLQNADRSDELAARRRARPLSDVASTVHEQERAALGHDVEAELEAGQIEP